MQGLLLYHWVCSTTANHHGPDLTARSLKKSGLECTMLKVGMKVLGDNNCELLVLDKSDEKQGS
jgi:hypothetical protein